MPDRSFPLSLAVLGSVPLGKSDDEERRVITDLVQQGLTADHDRTGWLERQKQLTRLRFGIRRPKDFPWPGCSNLSVPLIDSQIRRFKPLLMRLIVEPDPIVEFVGEDGDAVNAERLAESEYNWLFKTHMQAIEPMAYIIDNISHRGYGIAQVGWDYTTEYECRAVNVSDLLKGQEPSDPMQVAKMLAEEYNLDVNDPRLAKPLKTAVDRIMQGAEWVKLAFKRVVTDRPALWDRDPVAVIVPPRTTDYGNAEWIIVQHVLSVRKIKQMEADGLFEEGFCKKIFGDKKQKGYKPGEGVESASSPGLYNMDTLEDERERIWGKENEDNVLLWECFHWHDIDGDGLADRVVTFVHPKSRTKASSRPFPYPFRRWPFVKFDFEKTSRRFHSPRGISAMLENLQRETNAQHNARLDSMTLRNAPVYQVPVLAGFKARNFRATPGSLLQLPLGAQITPVLQDRGSFPESVNEETFLRQVAESYIGVFDNAVSGLGSADSRTATEVQAAVQLAASTASLDTILFQMAMRELHTMIWNLWLDLRPPEITIRVTGVDRAQTGPQSVTIKKGDIDKKFKLIPTGTIANTNHALELANAREALTFFANDVTGYVDPLELRRWYFGLLDFRIARKIVLGPEQAAEMQTLRQAAAALQQDPNLAAGVGAPVDAGVELEEQAPMVDQAPV